MASICGGCRNMHRKVVGERKSLSDVIPLVLEKLPEGVVVTPNDLRKIGVAASWSTILKAVLLISNVQKRLEEKGVVVDVWKEGREWKIGVRKRLYGMSREEKLKYLRERFFPEPDEKDLLLARLLKMDATSLEKGRKLKKGEIIEDMIKKGWLAEEDGKYYLTELGMKVAKVTLEMYPEG